jgi:hypothetical protein
VKNLKIIALLVFIGSVPFALWEIAPLTHPRPMLESPSNADILTVLFATATIVLAAVAIVIAVLAIWGYHAIKDEARGIAQRDARTAVRSYIKGKEVKEQIELEMRGMIEEAFRRYDEGLSFAQSQPPQDEVADASPTTRYPENAEMEHDPNTTTPPTGTD